MHASLSKVCDRTEKAPYWLLSLSLLASIVLCTGVVCRLLFASANAARPFRSGATCTSCVCLYFVLVLNPTALFCEPW
jgi:hypothetical protein